MYIVDVIRALVARHPKHDTADRFDIFPADDTISDLAAGAVVEYGQTHPNAGNFAIPVPAPEMSDLFGPPELIVLPVPSTPAEFAALLRILGGPAAEPDTSGIPGWPDF